MTKGLGESTWKDVLNELKRTIPYYERVNHLISLGLSGKMREVLMEISGIKAGDFVLDAGCGPGNMSYLIVERIKPFGRLICLDPLQSMLNQARKNLSKYSDCEVEIEFIRGRFEDLPVEDGCLDAVVVSYSFRDAVDRENALDEFRRILKKGGEFLTLDLTRSDFKPVESMVGLYIRWLVPQLSKLLYPWREGTPWRSLITTYERMPTSLELIELIGRYFKIKKVRRILFGTFTAIRAVKR